MRVTAAIAVLSLLALMLVGLVAVLVVGHFGKHITIATPGAIVKGIVSFDDRHTGMSDDRVNETEPDTAHSKNETAKVRNKGKNEAWTKMMLVVKDFEASGTTGKDQLSVHKGEQVFRLKTNTAGWIYAYTSKWEKGWVPDWALQPIANDHARLHGLPKFIGKSKVVDVTTRRLVS